MTKVKSSLFFFLILLFIACEKVIDFDDSSKSLLVMNGMVENNHEIVIRLTESKSILESDLIPVRTVNDAIVKLYVNGVEKETLDHKTINAETATESELNIGSRENKGELSFYFSNYRPKSGDDIYITASDATHPDIYSELKVPYQIPIISVETHLNKTQNKLHVLSDRYFDEKTRSESRSTDSTHFVFDNYLVKAKFQDRKDEKNFYRIELNLSRYYHDKTFKNEKIKFVRKDIFESINNLDHGTSLFTSSDEVFEFTDFGFFEGALNQNRETNPLLLFRDDLFNGEQYSLKLNLKLLSKIINLNEKKNPGYKKPAKTVISISLFNISEDYYKYLRTVVISQNREELFSEPVQIFTNVRNGLGIVASSAVTTFEVEIPS